MSGNNYEHSLFSCFKSPKTCCVTLACPCVTAGENRALADGRKTHGGDYIKGCCTGVCVRRKIRSKYGYPKAGCADLLTYLLCCPCFTCQDNNELKYILKDHKLLKGLYFMMQDEFKESTDQGITVRIKETWKQRAGEKWLYSVEFSCTNAREQAVHLYVSCDGINFEHPPGIVLPLSRILDAGVTEQLFVIEEKDMYGIGHYRYNWRWNSKPAGTTPN